jgi:tRNA pseudouridine13 synthase
MEDEASAKRLRVDALEQSAVHAAAAGGDDEQGAVGDNDEEVKVSAQAADAPRHAVTLDSARAARAYLQETRDLAGTLERMPPRLYVERLVLLKLLQHGPNEFLRALQGLPRTMRTFYFHSYQSYVWNRAASLRLTLLDRWRAVEGDLVLTGRGAEAAIEAAAEEAAAALGAGVEAEDGDDGKEDKDDAEEEDGDVDASEMEGEGARRPAPIVHIVTADEAAQGRFSIFDVVLPLPGASVEYPRHAVGRDAYERLMRADGVELSMFSNRQLTSSPLRGTCARRFVPKRTFSCYFLRLRDSLTSLALACRFVPARAGAAERP